MSDAPRSRPNILVTGTPGVGKTTFCQELETTVGLRHIEVARLIHEQKLYREWDDEMDCSIFDEDMVCDALEPLLEGGGCVLDFHSAGSFPDEWFDLIIVLRADTSVLYGRLERRHYAELKIQKNVEAEIFQTCLDEAREAFEESRIDIWEIHHDTQEQLAAAVERVKEFADQFAMS
mmetsp:Transcript_34767/g.75805  ORF Transcript_34767/g.75805 Transcript_34767/m.75805 type:complete len:177 (+) Transcript_34767:94-624(+)